MATNGKPKRKGKKYIGLGERPEEYAVIVPTPDGGMRVKLSRALDERLEEEASAVIVPTPDGGMTFIFSTAFGERLGEEEYRKRLKEFCADLGIREPDWVKNI